jgi:hypothetical protein
MALPWAAKSSSGAGSTQPDKKRAVGATRDDVAMLAAAAAKAVIGLEGRVRAVEGVTFRTFLLPKGHAVGVAGAAAGEQYSQAVQAAGKRHQHGQPYQWTYASILASIEAELPTGAEKSELQQILHLHQAGPTTFQEEVQWCTCKEQYKGEGYKLQISVSDKGRRGMEFISEFVKRTGGEEKFGQAPRGPAARNIIRLLKEQGHWEERD